MIEVEQEPRQIKPSQHAGSKTIITRATITTIDTSALVRRGGTVQSLAHANGIPGVDIELKVFGCFKDEHDGGAQVEFPEDLTLLQRDRLTARFHVAVVVG